MRKEILSSLITIPSLKNEVRGWYWSLDFSIIFFKRIRYRTNFYLTTRCWAPIPLAPVPRQPFTKEESYIHRFSRKFIFLFINTLIFLSIFSREVIALPQLGGAFREYNRLPSQVKESNNFLRAGGRLDYVTNTNHFSVEAHQKGFISLMHDRETNWLPDQSEPMKVFARITTQDSVIYATPALKSLELPPRDFSVKLYKPQDVPTQWVTRSGEFSEHIVISKDIQQATSYQLIWISWSPCYSNGILFNDHLVYSREDPCYDTMLHVITQEDTHVLQAGKNTITTLKTPLFQGQMVHGMKVQWPGIMVKIRYNLPQK